jgi:hypothetical protein
MTRCRGHDDLGSLTVELVVLTPVVFLFALMILVFGRVADARQQVAEAARSGAQVASVQPDAALAIQESTSATAMGVLHRAHLCAAEQVMTDTTRFVPGGLVRVTVVCQVRLSDLSVPGVPGTTTVQATSAAPIDPYRSVG